MLRWGLQHGRSVIPKSTTPSRIENINVFDFELSADELAAIDGLDTGRRGGPEPDAITLEASAARSRRPESRRRAARAQHLRRRASRLLALKNEIEVLAPRVRASAIRTGRGSAERRRGRR